jgi:hypothetical protein
MAWCLATVITIHQTQQGQQQQQQHWGEAEVFGIHWLLL